MPDPVDPVIATWLHAAYEPDEPLSADVEVWVSHRSFDVRHREGPNSLNIGPDKPLGSYGFSGFWTLCKALWRHRRPFRGADTLIVPGPSGGLWVYAWGPNTIQRLLDEHLDVLSLWNWPTEPRAFVERVRAEPVQTGTKLYDLIADAYGDRLNPGRTDVLPGTDRQLLLEAFFHRNGFEDPSAVYFKIEAQKRAELREKREEKEESRAFLHDIEDAGLQTDQWKRPVHVFRVHVREQNHTQEYRCEIHGGGGATIISAGEALDRRFDSRPKIVHRICHHVGNFHGELHDKDRPDIFLPVRVDVGMEAP